MIVALTRSRLVTVMFVLPFPPAALSIVAAM